jgi:CHAT domain-containing protein
MVAMNRRHLAAIATVVATAATAAVLYQNYRSDPWLELTIAASEGHPTAFAGRLSLIAIKTRPPVPPFLARGPASLRPEPPPNPTIRTLATRVLRSGTTEQQKATAALLAGDSAEALRRLQALVRDGKASADVWNDYAAVLTITHETGDGIRLLEALVAVDRALDLDTTNVAARFNRAIVLDRLNLNAAAWNAYREFLNLDNLSPYSDEARERMNYLYRDQPRAPGRQAVLSRLLLQAAAAGDDSTVVAAAMDDPENARAIAEDLLGQWGEEVMSGDAARAESLLWIARHIGRSLNTFGRDAMVSDAVAAIDLAGSHRRQRKNLAAAHAAFRRAARWPQITRFSPRHKTGEPPLRDLVRTKTTLFARAEDLFKRVPSPMVHLAAYYHAKTAFQSGNRRATVTLLASITRRAPPRYRDLHAQVHWLRGQTFAADGLLGEALTSYEHAASEFGRLHEHQNAVTLHYLSASLLMNLGRSVEAWTQYSILLSAVSRGEETYRLQGILYGVSMDALREGRPDIAYSFLTVVIAMANNPALIVQAMGWQALAAKRARILRTASGRLQAARDRIALLDLPAWREQAANELQLVEALMLDDQDSDRAISLLTEHLRVTAPRRSLIRLPEVLVERARRLRIVGRMSEAEADLRQAIDLVEARGRKISDDLFRDSFLGKSSDAYQMLADILDSRGAVEESLSIGDRRRARIVLDRIESTDLHEPVSGPDIVAVLPRRTAVLTYGIFTDRLGLFITSGDRLHQFSVPISSAKIEAMARSFTGAVERSDRDRVRTEGRALYDILIAPAHPMLADVDALIIVADAALDGVPFSALVQHDGRYLVERFGVTLAPSVSAWVSRRRESAAGPVRSILTVADPLLDPERYPSLPRLPYAQSEGKNIAALYPSSSVLIGKDATPERVTDALRRSDAAHFATHAIANRASPADSRLLLASAGAHDGALSAGEVQSMDLRHLKLAVLAGCETAVVGKGHGYIQSLAAAFIAAGTRNVVASLWDVDDTVAHSFSTAFYRALLNGDAPHAALRRAQLQMLRASDPKSSDPRAWAAMQIYGSGD